MRCPDCGARAAHTCEPTVAKVDQFFRRRLVHTKGRFAGKPFNLADWQRDSIITPMFGQLTFDKDLGRWVRQVRTAYVEIPRKNGKSELGAGIGLKLTFADSEQGAEVYSVAEDLDQANVVFAVAKTMVESNPALAKRARVYKRLIEVPKTGAIYRVLPADASGSHGLNIHGCIFDELHTQKTRELWDVMTSAQGTREQPLTVAFSTAGTDRHSICREQHDYGERLAKGLLPADPSFLYVRYGMPEGVADVDWEDESLWAEWNPALGDFLQRSFLKAEYRKAKASPARQNAFRNLYCNEWTQQVSRWMDLAVWDASAGPGAGAVDESNLAGRACFGAVDASRSQGIACLHWVFPGDDEHHGIWRFWLPKDLLPAADEETSGQASVWVKDGRLTLTDGNLVDTDAILKQIEHDQQQFDIRGDIAVKPGGASAPIIAGLDAIGIPALYVTQSVNNLSIGTHELERLVLAGKYRHGGHPVIRWQMDGLVVRRDAAGNLKPDPERSQVNITGCVCAVMALDRALREESDGEVGQLVSF